MRRAIALIDGEHYPPVVRFALEGLSERFDVVGAVFIGGTEKVDLDAGMATYGVDIVTAPSAAEALARAIDRFAPEVAVDLSDEPVVSAAGRFELASVALLRGVAYEGADFAFAPPSAGLRLATPTLGIIGTGKRVGKTAVSAAIARQLKGSGRDIVVLAMGRGGPATPELIKGDEVKLTTPDLLALARQGVHASSDNYEDAVMSRVTTVGCRRCGGGMAGETFFSNVAEGARLADSLGKELVMLEGSGSAIPPVHADASVLVIGAGRGVGYVRDYFGPYRLARADLAIIASAEEPLVSHDEVLALRDEIARQAPDLPVVATSFRPEPLEPIEGRSVFLATTAPAGVADKLAAHLAECHGAEVVAVSTNLSDRSKLREDLRRHAGRYDTLVTELKAAAIDVVAAEGEASGVPTVLCDNVPIALDGSDFETLIDSVATAAIDRGNERAREAGPHA